MQPNLNYDETALRNRYVERHGTDVGQFVFEAEVNRRRLQDARHTELKSELAEIHNQHSTLSIAAGQRQQRAQAKLAVAFAAYQVLCEAEAKASSLEQAQLAPLSARSTEIQQQMRTIVQPRLSEREMQDVAIYQATAAQRQAPPARST